MSLTVIGINHKSAPVAIREKVAYSQGALVDSLCRIHSHRAIEGLILVSTCNRTEWVIEHTEMTDVSLIEWLEQDVGAAALQDYIYVSHGEDAVTHLIGMASGLDSMVLGEPQILGQVKASFRHAKEADTVSPLLHRVFQHVFKAAKRIRTETAIGENAVSVAYVAVQLAKQLFSQLKSKQVLLIGAGDTVTRVATHLAGEGVSAFWVANRTLARGQELAEQLQKNGATVKTLTLESMAQVLPEMDMVVSSTGSPVPVLGKGIIENALQTGRIRPLFMLDLAVPRDIEPQASELEHVYLYSIDDLESVVAHHVAERHHEKASASLLAEEEAAEFMHWLKAQDAVEILKTYRQQMGQQKEEILVKAKKRLQQGEAAEDILHFLAERLTNTLIHAPSLAIKDAAAKKSYDKLAILKETFGL